MGAIIKRNNIDFLNLVERGKRTITSASLSQGMLTDDTVKFSVSANSKLDIKINDTVEVFGNTYRINALPTFRKVSNTSYSYDIEAQGLMYDLLRCKFFNADADGFKTTTNFPLIGNLETFLIAIRNNMQRFSTLWEIGTVASTETKMITFGDDTCLSALQKICQEFKTDFWVKTDAGKFKIHTGNFGSTLPIDFEHGKGKGLYALNRANVDDNDIVNRLYVNGGTENIPAGYRNFSDSLKFSDAGYLEDAALIAEMGLKEGSMEFPDIYPKRTGVVSSLGSTKFKFIDSSMDFDLNAKNTDGSTKYLIAGTTAKIHFNKGNLAGYEFEIKKNGYNTATKEFELIPFKNESGQQFPDPDAAAFQIGVGDEYVLLDIVMPDTYIANAEAELLAKATEQFALKKVAKVSYDLDVDPEYIKTLATPISIGDYVRVIDTALGIDKVIRVQSITRQFITGSAPTPYNYKLTLADSTEISYGSQMLLDITDIKSVISITKLGEINLSQLGYKTTQELRNLIFDTDNYFNPENIKPFSIETNMISVGAQSQQLSSSVVFMVNNAGNPNQIEVKAGVIFSQTFNKSWTISGGIVTIPDNNFRYVYGKCSKTGTTGTIHFTQSQIKFDEDPNDYYFLIGILHSVEEGIRVLSITIGTTTINAGLIRTGIISSLDGQTYFNLNTGEIGGRIIFKAGSSGYANLIDKPDLSSFEATRDYVNSALQTDLADLKNRADGVIESWFYSHSPNLTNLPASNWTTNEQRDSHIGDTFTNMQEFVDNTTTPDAGKAWRFARNADNSYSWNLIANSDSTKALIEAGKAKDTADSKRRVFIAQPFPPYDLGDLWSQGTTGDLMRCKFARTSGVYVATDWEKASKYTDDTRAIQAETAAKEYTDDIKSQIDGELSDLATEITNLSDAVTELPIGALTDTVLFGIKQQKNSVQSQDQDVYSRYLIIRDDTALLNKIPVTEAFASYYNAYNSLITYFDSAFNDSAITQAEKDELTARFTAYKNQVSLFATALQNAVQAIQEQKIDNIQIGGRNLILNSNGLISPISSYGAVVSESLEIPPQFTAGKSTKVSPVLDVHYLRINVINEPGTYTFSAWVKRTNGNDYLLNINANDVGGKSFIITNAEWRFITHTIKVDDVSSTYNFFDLRTNTMWVEFLLYHPQIEKGNKATDWKPANEDIDAEFVLVKSEINDVDNKLTNLQTNFTDFASDGVINIAEAKALKNIVQTLNNEKEDIYQKYLQAYNDANLIDKNPLLTAWNNYDSNHDTLLNYINTYTAGNRAISPAELDTVNTSFTNYRTTLSALSAELEIALKAISNKLIDNIQIGGRNYLLGSNVSHSNPNTSIWIPFTMPKEFFQGKTMTLSCDVEIVNGQFGSGNRFGAETTIQTPGGYDYLGVWDYVTVAGQTTKRRLSTTINMPANIISLSPLGLHIEAIGDLVKISNPKLEEGNKATDWSPAPEDVEADILTAKTAAESAAKAYSDTQDNLREITANAYADGKVTAAESRAIADATAKMEAAKAHANSLVTVHDTRNDNQPPSWYFTNYPRQTVSEFKTASIIGINGIDTYGILITKVPWDDLSGGHVVQEFSILGQVFIRSGNTSTWSAWVNAAQLAATAKAEATNAQNTAAAAAAVTSFLNTDVNGNVVSTGTLQVGSATGANAGITGIVDRAGASVRFYAGSTYAGKNTARWLVRDDGVEEQWYNGVLIQQNGIIGGVYAENSYNLNGQLAKKKTYTPDGKILEEWYNNGSLVYQIGQNGIYYVAEIAESYSLRRFRNLNTNISTSDLQSFEADLRTYMWQKTANPTQFELRGDKDAYLYMAGQNVYSEGNKQYEGYKNTQSKTDNITDGWYAEEKLGSMMADATFETKRIANVVKIQAGKIVQSGFVTIETQGYTFNQF